MHRFTFFFHNYSLQSLMHLYENLNQLLVTKKFEFWYVKVVEQERQQRDGMDLDGESVKRSVES